MNHNILARRSGDLNIGWAQRAINKHHSRTVVSNVNIVSIDIGTTTRIRLAIEHNGPAALPRQWFAKLPSLMWRARMITAFARLYGTRYMRSSRARILQIALHLGLPILRSIRLPIIRCSLQENIMNDILKARLEAIDADCESAAKMELDTLSEAAPHDNNNTKNCAPSPQAVEAIWLKLIASKEHEFIDEIARILKPKSASGSTIQSVIPDKEFVSTVEAMVDAMFAEDRYVDRMRDFYHPAARKAPVDEPFSARQAKRPDLIDTAYRTGIQNALRRSRQTVLREFDLYKPLKAPENTGFLSGWRHYSTLSPWRSLGTIVMLSLTSYLIAFIIASDSFRGLLERFGWSTGTGL